MQGAESRHIFYKVFPDWGDQRMMDQQLVQPRFQRPRTVLCRSRPIDRELVTSIEGKVM